MLRTTAMTPITSTQPIHTKNNGLCNMVLAPVGPQATLGARVRWAVRLAAEKRPWDDFIRDGTVCRCRGDNQKHEKASDIGSSKTLILRYLNNDDSLLCMGHSGDHDPHRIRSWQWRIDFSALINTPNLQTVHVLTKGWSCCSLIIERLF